MGSAGDEKPRVEEAVEKVVVKRGKSAALTCSIYGQPTPDITWMRFGKEVQRGKKFKVNWDGRIASLLVSDVDDFDAGKYNLYASNKLGYVETEGLIIVEGSPKLYENDFKYTRNMTIRQGQTLRLYVPFHGYPMPTVAWMLNEKE